MDPNERDAVYEVGRGLRRQLEWMNDAGFVAIARGPETLTTATAVAEDDVATKKKSSASASARNGAVAETRRASAAERGSHPLTLAQKREALESIGRAVADCTLCGLCKGRTNAVPGEGSPGARVLFVGEGPGATEDEQGRPFVGRAGQLLTKIIESGMGLRREDVFIANIVKCRPPENRDPLPGEVAACVPYLLKQIEVIDPEVIIPLGRHSMRELAGVGERDTISKVRGKVYRVHGRAVIPTFHPAYLLRNPPEKAKVWSDIQLAMKELGLPIPGSGNRANSGGEHDAAAGSR